MVPQDDHQLHHVGASEPSHEHRHGHGHVHSPAMPHPAQSSPWSILRMPLASRLGAALAASAALWAAVLLAMR